jgi:trimethylamine--corrinoid protein Co-methyltransferase
LLLHYAVEDSVAKAPSQYKLHIRHPARRLDVGGNAMIFSMVTSPPNASDAEGGRRPGNMEDYENFIRLSQSLNIVHLIGGYPVEPIDVEPRIRHLVAERAAIKLSGKFCFGYALGRERIRDSIEMIRIARGIDYETMSREPSIITVVNANSPLQYDIPMLNGMIEMAKLNQPVIVTPFTLAGAMAPVTLAGALVQQNAEALAGIAFMQIVNPGAPVMYGGFTSNVDMKSGAPAFGTPEYAKAVLVGGQLARRYGVPYRSSNVNASCAPDVQAAYESQMSIWPCVLGHVNFVKHALGWIEGGLTASFEKVVIDAEMLQMISEFLRPVAVNEDEMALSAMKEVGPGGHYFGCAHTMERYENAFYAPMLSDWRNFETWQETGSKDATERANAICKHILAAYEPPDMDPAVEDELDAFVERRIHEGGATPDT